MMGCARHKWPVWVLFGVYCLVLLWLMFFGRIGAPSVGQVNLHPLQTLNRYLWVLRHSTEPGLRHNAMANLLGNVAMFIPLGLFLPVLFAALRKFWRFALLAFALILALEMIQLVTGLGTLDVDDLLLNFPGALLGYLLWYLLNKASFCGGDRTAS